MTPLHRGTAAAALAALAVAPPAYALPGTLHLGFLDDGIAFDPDPAMRAAWLDRVAGLGTDRMRINVAWSRVATRAPIAGDDPKDPEWPGYNWTALDAAVRETVNHGLTPVLTIGSAPAWAEGPGRPPSAPAGSWRPDPTALAAFAAAAAARYSGRSADLPVVRYWQVWNEPNLDLYLTPQWSGDQPASPAYYRRMLNAAYMAIKAVDPANVVLAAGTAPYGDPGHRQRMRPARFVRELLCLKGPSLRPAPCPDPARFDILDHHPYATRGPRKASLNADDVSIPDLGKLIRPLRRAERTGRALGPRHHPVWVTEISWDSSPPDPEGVPAQTHARWLEEAFYVLWHQGIGTIMWLQARDAAPVPSYAATYQSGVFFRDGRPKPAARAFAFPFVAERLAGGRVRLWGRAPQAGAVSVQRRMGGRSTRIASFGAGAPGRVFTTTLRVARGSRLVARTGNLASLTWVVR